jgi:hypothetical protein
MCCMCGRSSRRVAFPRSSTLSVGRVSLVFLGVGFLVSGLFTNPAHATAIVSPVAVINNSLGEWSSSLAVEFMIDQSGLSSGFTSGTTDFTNYIGTSPTHVANQFNTLWGSRSGQTSGVVDFDLGSAISINEFVLWSDASNGGASSGIKEFRLYASLASDFSENVLLGTFIGPLGLPTPTPLPATVYSFAPTPARFVRLEIINHWGDPNINIHEVAFGATVVPEPAALGLAVGVLGLWSFYYCRR